MCAACGTRRDRHAPAATASAEFSDRVKLASRDAVDSFRSFAPDPVARLEPVYQALAPQRALAVGIAFALVFELCLLAGFYLAPQRSDWWFPFGSTAARPGVADYLKTVVLGLVPLAGLAAGSAATRSFTSGAARYEGDLFIAGAALLPFGLLLVISGFLGPGNVQAGAFLSVIALSYTTLLLYAGFTRISYVSSQVAVLVVPITLAVVGWISRAVSAAVR